MEGVWSIEEENFLKQNYKKMEYKQIGKIIGKSKNAVAKKVQRINLVKIEKKDRIENELPRVKQVAKEINGRLNMRKYGINKTIGDKVKVSKRYNPRKSRIRSFEGEIIFKNNSIVTLQGKHYRESFMLSEFFTGQAVIS